MMSDFLGRRYLLLDGASGYPLPENIESLNTLTPARGSMNILFKTREPRLN